MNVMSAAEASSTEVESPTSVAAPSRLADTAMPMRNDTGETRNLFETSSAIGAIMSTVATLSMKAETTAERMQTDRRALGMVPDLFTVTDAR